MCTYSALTGAAPPNPLRNGLGRRTTTSGTSRSKKLAYADTDGLVDGCAAVGCRPGKWVAGAS
ncbi:hypothetical protein ACVWWN_002757 [Mycobacterium sp. URHB0021]